MDLQNRVAAKTRLQGEKLEASTLSLRAQDEAPSARTADFGRSASMLLGVMVSAQPGTSLVPAWHQRWAP